MANSFVIDAHALIWFLEGNAKLGLQAKAVMEDPMSVLLLPAIALAEALWAVEHGRTVISSPHHVAHRIRSDARIEVVALDFLIVERAMHLSSIGEMHDRQIVATALSRIEKGELTALLTRDVNITASGLIPVIW